MSIVDLSGRSSSQSSKETSVFEAREAVLFNAKNYADIEADPERSLGLLSNCVLITVCTILHERKLIPKKAFKDFDVYGTTKGYIVNDDDFSGELIIQKYIPISDAISDKSLKKFALIVETEDQESPVEAFIWSFKYEKIDEAIAEFGFRGKKQKFTVKYKDMDETCRQFCQLFSNLKSILDTLSPLPLGVIPSFRVAFRDSFDMKGYFVVDEFVNMKQLSIGKVRYPREVLQMTYCSDFAPREETMNMENTQNTEIGNLMFTNVDSPQPRFEETRHSNEDDLITDRNDSIQNKTLEVEEKSNDVSLNKELIDEPMEIDFGSLQCEINSASQNERQGSSAETVKLNGEDGVYGKIENTPIKAAKERKSTSVDVYDLPSNEDTSPVVSNIVRKKKTVKDPTPQRKSLRQERRKRRSAPEQIEVDSDEEELHLEKESPVFAEPSSIPAGKKKVSFGRVPSILTVVSENASVSPVKISKRQENATPTIDEAVSETVRKTTVVKTVQDPKIKEKRERRRTLDPIVKETKNQKKSPEVPNPASIPQETKKRMYGRVPSLLSVASQTATAVKQAPSRKYGRVISLKSLDESPVKKAPETRKSARRRFVVSRALPRS